MEELMERLEQLKEELYNQCYITREAGPGNEIECLNNTDSLSTVTLEAIIETIEAIEAIDTHSTEICTEITEYINFDSNIYNLANFDLQDRQNEIIEENSLEATEERLNEFVQLAAENSQEELDDLWNNAGDDIKSLFENINRLVN